MPAGPKLNSTLCELLQKVSHSPARRQVCGSDGLTYPSACHLREKACRKGKAIPIAYKGPCQECDKPTSV
ncbi:hypothetical protein NQ318_001062 [Aromia moschata]|uniref:Kazal-like domain-containing protein n=1 Tax=Aromia moschata TaxID=1265417 RepID=A0AAV8ZG18_9CUCU|nr:hypothetical protein NQ318_001062 [Aromia moschata]